jgi:hypothetical protein
MMMSGLTARRTGVPANVVYDRRLGVVRTLDRPSDLKAPTVISRLNRAGFTTGTVLSKDYLYGILGDRGDPPLGSPPHLSARVRAQSGRPHDGRRTVDDRGVRPNLVFLNLGDVDRMGHADATGVLDLEAARRAALADTDTQINRLVHLLRSSGRWDDSCVIVLADHSMDWSRSDRVVSVGEALDPDPLLQGRVALAENGGAELLYWLGHDRRRDAAIERMQEICRAVPGVQAAHRRTRPFLHLGPEAGDVVLYCGAGWRFSESPGANPIPGNHGHPATRPIPFFLSGGHPLVRQGRRPELARTIDVAPTLARFFAVGSPPGGYDGRSRLA